MRKGAIGSVPPAQPLILAAAGILLAAASLRAPAQTCWWEIRLLLTARGNYAVRDSGAAYDGDFLFRAEWEGAMERDEEDFILYHAKTETRAWEIREKASPAEGARTLTEKDAGAGPRLRVNYVLREGERIVLDFEAEGIRVPLHESAGKLDLPLPRSREHARDETRYADSVCEGDNRVSFTESDLGKPRCEKFFAWEWKRRQWVAAGNGAIFLGYSHKAAVTVTLIPHAR
jgi:hypothetical protein